MMKNLSTCLVTFMVLIELKNVQAGNSDCKEVLSKVMQFNSNNTEESPANWPWLVPLFYTFNHQFFCSGTLISERHVVTAAHCLSGSKFFTPSSNVIASFGGSNLSDTSSALIKNITKINFHPKYQHKDGNFDGDIAILTFASSVNFTGKIAPACLPEGHHSGSESGKFIGFKKSRENLKSIELPVKNITSCLLGDESCQIHNQTLACDSISAGFYDDSGRIVGLFSKGLGEVNSELCGVNNFIAFTFIDEYLKWIQDTINEHPETERDGKNLLISRVQAFCDYKWNYQQSLPLYTCIIRGLIVHSSDVTIDENISGIHGDDDTDFDVERIHVVQSQIFYLPSTSTIANKFKNINNFWVENSKLKFVTRSALKPLSNLTILSFSMNEITDIPGDCFEDLTKLEFLWIHSNKIFKVEENLFSSLEKLKVIDMRNNFIESLPEKLFASNRELKVINFENNKLKFIKAELENSRNLKWVVLRRNKCIDTSYCKALDCLKSLKQLINLIKEVC